MENVFLQEQKKISSWSLNQYKILMKGRRHIWEIFQKFKFFPNNILGVSHKKYFQNANDSWLQSTFNILSFKSNKFDMKHKILLIKHVLNIETSLRNTFYNFLKYLAGSLVNQIVNKWFNLLIAWSLQFAKMMFEKLFTH